MCGIVGFIDGRHTASGSENETILRRANASLRHRGPDDEGLWAAWNIGLYLGHTRLAIQDLSADGHQPMESGSRRYILALNGEIYNFLDLRNELTNAGLPFHGRSDTEVLLVAIEHWGLRPALQRVVGMFAFALFDQVDRKLFLCRDRIGEKPLYAGWVGRRFAFASELRAFRELPGWQGEISRNALQLFMQFNTVPAPFSIFAGISKLRPAELVEVDLVDVDLPQRRERYWPPGEERRVLGAGEARDMLLALLEGTMGEKLHADVPVGVFLSGGVDASLVASVTQRVSVHRLRTFTIGFPEEKHDEARDAEKIARIIGTDHQQLVVSPRMAMDVIHDLPGIYDEPLGDSSQIPQVLLSRLTRGAVAVALSGDGGDELFGGYRRYRLVPQLWDVAERHPRLVQSAVCPLLEHLPSWVSRPLLRVAGERLPAHHKYGDPVRRLRLLASALRAPDPARLYRSVATQVNDAIPLDPAAAGADVPFDACPITADATSMMRADLHPNLSARYRADQGRSRDDVRRPRIPRTAARPSRRGFRL